MCGIAGFLGQPNRELLKKLSQTLIHRGPDDSGEYEDGFISLAFRRMSVLDLDQGNQPIFSNDSQLVGIVNGEIYNYRELRSQLIQLGHKFKSNSDSEVVIHGYRQWGTNIFSRLRGMFAVALWDSNNENLILARDPIGKKPLHFFQDKNSFIFSSEIKTIAEVHKNILKINTDSMIEYFSLESVGNTGTIYSNIYKVEAGHFLVVDKNHNITKSSFWKPNLEIMSINKNNLVDQVDLKIGDSVKKRLIADVPIGLFLSGGIDSATILAKISELGRKDVKIFTAKFDDDSYDESAAAKSIANSFGYQTIELPIVNRKAQESLDSVIECIDEPLADPAIIPQLILSKYAKEHVDVVLTGDGGDELFLGYPNFIAHNYVELMKVFKPFFSTTKFILNQIPSRGNYFDLGFKAQRISRGLNEKDYWFRDFEWRGAFTRRNLPKLIKSIEIAHVDSLLQKRIFSELESLGSIQSKSQQISYGYLATYLRDNVLVKVDRATMRYGLEARSPLLDVDLFEFVNRIPDNHRLSRIGSKNILKNVLRKYLPDHLIAKNKHGLGVPVAKWLNSELKDQLLDFMNPTYLNNQGLFDHVLINQMQRQHLSGRYDYRKELWSFLIFQRWYAKWMN